MTRKPFSVQSLFSEELCAALTIVVILGAVILGVAALYPDDREVVAVVSSGGYSKVEVLGFEPLRCGEDDMFRIGFRAVGQSGERVRGVYCGAPLKGATVRIIAVENGSPGI
jgi:hypothetical protein